MKWNLFLFFIILISSCTTAKLSVPDQFTSKATKMPVKGLNGWMVNQKLTFGNYQTSFIKRGWDFASSVQYTRFRKRPEEVLLKVFHIDVNNNDLKQRNKFQYTVQDGNLIAEVYATENFSEKQLVYKSNNPYIGSASKTKRYEYAFTAAIVPLNGKDDAPWSVVLINTYNIARDTARRWLDKPYVEEEGYATDGKETVAIRPLRVEKVTTKSGKETNVLGGQYLAGYELRIDNEVRGVIDILDNNIWIYNDLEPAKKLILSSIASAILLKRMQDTEKDKDEFQNRMSD